METVVINIIKRNGREIFEHSTEKVTGSFFYVNCDKCSNSAELKIWPNQIPDVYPENRPIVFLCSITGEQIGDYKAVFRRED